VPFFQTITSTADLPGIGLPVEGRALDFKGRVAFDTPEQRRELAKDVAEFANAMGGVILVGAYEANGRLGTYKGLTAKEAAEVKNAYETSAREFCAPVPTTDVQIIPLSDGSGFVVAVNAYPLAGQAVGLLWQRDGGCPAYAFPFRPGEKTVWLRPEQLPMLMVPEIRRMAILLDSIPLEERAEVDIVAVAHTGSASSKNTLRFVRVDIQGSCVIFSEGGGGGAIISTSIPLDAMKLVWRNFGRWSVMIRGTFQKKSDGLWDYTPL
jgi:hypothetical protein